MNKPRKQTYTMDMYLNKIRDKDIRSDADVQRLAGQWKNGQTNELIYTVLTDDYIPPVILGEEKGSQLWVIDGLQRSTSLMKFRYANYKITNTNEEFMIFYRAKKRDKKGNILQDEKGDIIWEDAACNLKNKTYARLPEELKKRFNEYQIETVIHEDCDMKRISQLIRRYNNHTSMNAAQRAFTNVEKFAREIRAILNLDFFAAKELYGEGDRIKGNLERVVLESVMCMFHLEDWKTAPADIAKYINKNARKEEFDRLRENVIRLGRVITDDAGKVFTIKDSFIWLTFYDRFLKLGLEDDAFITFIRAFQKGLRNQAVDGVLFDMADQTGSTKDKTVVTVKLHILDTLLHTFLDLDSKEGQEEDVLTFVKAQADPSVTAEDIGYHSDNLSAWTVGISDASPMKEHKNLPSMIAIAVYAFYNEEACDDETMIEWFADYESRNPGYIPDQRENYLHMKTDLIRFINSKCKRPEQSGQVRFKLSKSRNL